MRGILTSFLVMFSLMAVLFGIEHEAFAATLMVIMASVMAAFREGA